MSFIAELEIDGQTLNVLECNYGFSQATDNLGKPSAMPKGGAISLTIESSKDTDLVQWMVSPDQKKGGTITFKRHDFNAPLRTVEFSDAVCVQFHESFNSTDTSPMITHIVISAREMKIGSVSHVKNWGE